MRKNKSTADRVKLPAPTPRDTEDRFTAFVLEEEEDAPCSEYIIMSQERHLPALQEYLHEMHAGGARPVH